MSQPNRHTKISALALVLGFCLLIVAASGRSAHAQASVTGTVGLQPLPGPYVTTVGVPIEITAYASFTPPSEAPGEPVPVGTETKDSVSDPTYHWTANGAVIGDTGAGASASPSFSTAGAAAETFTCYATYTETDTSVDPWKAPGTGTTTTITTTTMTTPVASVTAYVTVVGTFTIAPNPSRITGATIYVPYNSSAQIPMLVTSTNDVGTVGLSVAAGSGTTLPSGISLGVTSSVYLSGPGSVSPATLSIGVSSSVTPGTYAINVSGESVPAATGANCPLTLIVEGPAFSLSPNPTDITAYVDNTVSFDLNGIFQNDISGSVTLNPVVWPSGPAVAFGSTSFPTASSSTTYATFDGTVTANEANVNPATQYYLDLSPTNSGSYGTVTTHPATIGMSITVLPPLLYITNASVMSDLLLPQTSTPGTIELDGEDGLNGSVNVGYTVQNAVGNPSGDLTVTCPSSISMVPVGGEPFPSTAFGDISIAASATAAGQYTVTFTAVRPYSFGNVTSNTAAINIYVPPSGFTLGVSPSSQTIDVGGTGSATATVLPTGSFTGSVGLSVSVTGGVTASLSPSTITGGSGTSAISISVPTGTAPGTYTGTVTGTSSTATPSSETAAFSVIVPPSGFNLSVAPGHQRIDAGQGGSATVTISPFGGFTGAVGISVSVAGGITASASPTTVSGGGGTSAITLTVPAGTAPGTYAGTVTGSSSTATPSTQAATFTVVVPPAGFRLSASPPAQKVNVGDSGSATATVSPFGGFTGTVGLSVAIPGGITSSMTPTSVSGGSGSSAISFTVPVGTTAGAYTGTVTGSSSTATPSSQTATFTVNVADFTPSITGPVTVSIGGSATTQASVIPLNGFTGTVAFATDSSDASGISISGSGGPGAPFTLTVSAGSAALGTYSVLVDAGCGNDVHKVTVSVNVSPPRTWDVGTPLVLGSILPVGPQVGGGGTVSLSIAGSSDSDHWTATDGTSGTDPDPLSFSWTDGSSQSGSGTSFTWTAPAFVPGGSNTYTITCNVVETKTVAAPDAGTRVDNGVANPGGTDETPTSQPVTTTVTVAPKTWAPGPPISGGMYLGASPIEMMVGDTHTVSIVPASDTDVWTAPGTAGGTGIDPVNYTWAGTNVTTANSPSLAWTAPTTATNYTLTCTVDDAGLVPAGDLGTTKDGPLSPVASVTMQVMDFTPSITDPQPVTVSIGGTESVQAAVAPINGFDRTVTFATSPTDMTGISVTGSGGPSAPVTLNVSPGSVAPGSYTVQLIATCGSVTHPLTLSVTVTGPRTWDVGDPMTVDTSISTVPSTASTTLVAGSTIALALNGSDSDHWIVTGTTQSGTDPDPLHFAWSDGNGESGVGNSFTWTAPPYNPTGNNTYTVTCLVTETKTVQPPDVGSRTDQPGGMSRSIVLTVMGGFTVGASLTNPIVDVGETDPASITVTPQTGYSGSVMLSATASTDPATGQPANITVGSYVTNPLRVSYPNAASTTAMLTAGANVTPGVYTITIIGTDGTTTATTTVSVTVGSFTIAATQPTTPTAVSPAVLWVQLLGTASTTIAVTPNPTYTGTVGLSSNADTTLGAGFAPPSVALGGSSAATSVLSFSPTLTATTGPHTVTVTGTDAANGLAVPTTVTVNLMDFSLSASAISILAGKSQENPIVVTPNGGFLGLVTLAANPVTAGTDPNGNPISLTSPITVDFSTTGPNPVPIASASSNYCNANVTVPAGTPTGTYPVTATATNNAGPYFTNTVFDVEVSAAGTAVLHVIWTPDYTTQPPTMAATSGNSTVGGNSDVHLTVTLPPGCTNPTITSLNVIEVDGNYTSLRPTGLAFNGQPSALCGEPAQLSTGYTAYYCDLPWNAVMPDGSQTHNGIYSISAGVTYAPASGPPGVLSTSIEVSRDDLVITGTTPSNPTPIKFNPPGVPAAAGSYTVPVGATINCAYKAPLTGTVTIYDTRQIPLRRFNIPADLQSGAALTTDGSFTLNWDGTPNLDANGNQLLDSSGNATTGTLVPKGIYIFEVIVNGVSGDSDQDKSQTLSFGVPATQVSLQREADTSNGTLDTLGYTLADTYMNPPNAVRVDCYTSWDSADIFSTTGTTLMGNNSVTFQNPTPVSTPSQADLVVGPRESFLVSPLDASMAHDKQNANRYALQHNKQVRLREWLTEGGYYPLSTLKDFVPGYVSGKWPTDTTKQASLAGSATGNTGNEYVLWPETGAITPSPDEIIYKDCNVAGKDCPYGLIHSCIDVAILCGHGSSSTGDAFMFGTEATPGATSVDGFWLLCDSSATQRHWDGVLAGASPGVNTGAFADVDSAYSASPPIWGSILTTLQPVQLIVWSGCQTTTSFAGTGFPEITTGHGALCSVGFQGIVSYDVQCNVIQDFVNNLNEGQTVYQALHHAIQAEEEPSGPIGWHSEVGISYGSTVTNLFVLPEAITTRAD